MESAAKSTVESPAESTTVEIPASSTAPDTTHS